MTPDERAEIVELSRLQCRDAFEVFYRRKYQAYPAEERDRLVKRRGSEGYWRAETYQDYVLFKAGWDAART